MINDIIIAKADMASITIKEVSVIWSFLVKLVIVFIICGTNIINIIILMYFSHYSAILFVIFEGKYF